MYKYDLWLENLRISMTEKERPIIAKCYRCNEDLYEGEDVLKSNLDDIFLCKKCLSHIEDEKEFEFILDNFDEIKLKNYYSDFFEDDKYDDWE